MVILYYALDECVKAGKLKAYRTADPIILDMQNSKSIHLIHSAIEKKYNVDLRVGKHIKTKTVKERRKERKFSAGRSFWNLERQEYNA